MTRFNQFALALVGVAVMGVSAAQAATVFGNFEDGATDGFGNLTNSGVTKNTFASPTSAAVITPTTGGNTTKVLDLTAAGYNGGQGSGTDLGYDFAANGLTAAFQANTMIEFDWQVAPSATTTGYSQLYQFVLNGPGAGYTGFGGASNSTSANATATGTVNQNPPYSGQVNHIVIDYSKFKAALTGTGYIQFGITTNNGGGAPADFYFDNFQLTGAPAVPEPATLGVVAASLVGVGGLRRRRRA